MTDTPTPPGTPLPTVNPVASGVNRTIQSIVANEIPLAEATLIIAQPWLGWPIISLIWENGFSYFVNQLGRALGLWGGHIVLDIETYGNLINAGSALVALNAAKASGNAQQIEQASAAADAAAAPILHYVGSP